MAATLLIRHVRLNFPTIPRPAYSNILGNWYLILNLKTNYKYGSASPLSASKNTVV